jgi:hypothetical protein
LGGRLCVWGGERGQTGWFWWTLAFCSLLIEDGRQTAQIKSKRQKFIIVFKNEF